MAKERLVVYVPGITMNTKQWAPLIEKLKTVPELANAEWLGWDHHCGMLSTANILSKASALNAAIDAKWRQAGTFNEIVLLGHSFGGILVRVA